jgi:hypothetical protein
METFEKCSATMRKILLFSLLSIFLSNCSSSIDEVIYQCEDVPVSNIWGKWREVAFQKRLQGFTNFDTIWTISTNKNLFYINSCNDISIEQRKIGAGCCSFLYYKLLDNKLIASGLGGGKECANISCAPVNYKLTIEKLNADSLTLINDLGRSKYVKIK